MVQRLPFAICVLACLLSACATTPKSDAPASDQDRRIEGQVVSVDTSPWAYDGNAVVVVSAASGEVAVQLPARWNLCKAPPPDDVQSLKAGDHVEAVGTMGEQSQLIVCQQPTHHLRRLP